MLVPFLTRLATLVQGRAHPAPAPPDTAPPYITLTTIGSAPGMALDGLDGSHALAVQIDCWHTSAARAQALGWQAVAALASPDLGIGEMRQLPTGYEPEPRLHRVTWEVQALHSLPTSTP